MFEGEYYISFESGYLKIGQTNYLQPTSAIFFFLLTMKGSWITSSVGDLETMDI